MAAIGEATYASRVRIERIRGPLRRAFLPGEPEPVLFGVHDEIAEHYGVAPGGEAEHAATLDYIVAAAAG
jgi:hypothetical protein